MKLRNKISERVEKQESYKGKSRNARKEKAPFPLRELGLSGGQSLCGDHREMNTF